MAFDAPIHANDNTLDRVLQAGLPVLLVFGGPQCRPCEQLEPTLLRVAKAYAGEVLVVKLDASANNDGARRFQVDALPTLLFIKTQTPAARIRGSVDDTAVKAHLDYLLGRGPQPETTGGPSIPFGTQPAAPGEPSSPVKAETGNGKPLVVSDATFEDMVLRSPKPVLVDFWAAWCGPCRMVAPVVEQLAGEFNGRAVVAKLDVDANPGTAQRYNVRSIPTLLIFRDGRMVDQIVGAQPAHVLRQHLAAAAGAR